MITRSEIKHWMHKEPVFDDTMCSLNAAARIPKAMIKETRRVMAIARKFKEEVVKPQALELDRRMQQDPEYLPWEFIEKANQWRFFSMWIPKPFGGMGYNTPSLSYFLEEIAAECLAMANLIGVHYLAITAIFSTWNIKVIEKLCRLITLGEKNGRPCLFSTAITEPNAGTDVEEPELVDKGDITCIATRADGGYVLNGTKIFISNGHLSRWHMVIAYVDQGRPSENTIMLAVENGTPGFNFGRKEKKMGQMSCPASELIFKECFVPDEWVLLDPGQAKKMRQGAKAVGAQMLDYTLSSSRAGVSAFGTGAARGAFECALEFAVNTEVDGKLLANHEWVQSMLAEMYRNVAVARMSYTESNYANGMYGLFSLLQQKPMYYFYRWLPQSVIDKWIAPFTRQDAVTRISQKFSLEKKREEEFQRIAGWGSLAKFTGTDAGMKNCQMAVELMGQAGLRQDRKIEKMLRDAKLLQIYEGTNQLNRLNLFKCLVARNYPQVRVFEAE